MHLAQIVAALDVIKNESVRQHFLRKILNRRGLSGALFELFVYATYLVDGHDIRLYPESAAPGIRTPDFYIVHDGQVVLVECKSLEDDTQPGDYAWSIMELRIAKALKKHSNGYEVQVDAKEELTQQDAVNIAKLAERALASGPGAYDLGKVKLEILLRTQFGAYQPFPEYVEYPEGFRAFLEFEVHRGLNLVRKISGVVGRPFLKRDQTDRILSNISNASGQLFDGYPGIIHIQIPYNNSRHFQEVIDDAFDPLYRRVQQESRANAVIVTGRFVDEGRGEHDPPIIANHSVIPNMNAPITLPKGFRLMAADEPTIQYNGQPLIDDPSGALPPAGTIMIARTISAPLSEFLGRSVFKYCSPDGRHQLIVWQNFKNELAFDLIHEAYGYRRYRADFNEWPPNVMTIFGMRWAEDEIDLILEGQFVPNGGAFQLVKAGRPVQEHPNH